MKARKKAKKSPSNRPRLSGVRIEEMVAEAIVDCYNESEQRTGLLTMIQDRLALPFRTRVLGTEVTVEKVDFNEGDEIVAFCRSGREKQKIPILDLPLPSPPPAGWEWIEAYRHWSRGF
jgi:hypothetical protein